MEHEIGRATSIIDGHIQVLLKRLKDASAEDREIIQRTIDVLEKLWDGVAPRYIRPNMSASSLDKPTRELNFPYRIGWSASGKFTENTCDIYSVSFPGGFPKWTLVLAEEENNVRYLFKSADESDTVSMIRAFDKISYPGKQGKKLAGFIYPYCLTLAEYVGKLRADTMSDLPQVIKGLICSLVALEERFEKEGEKIDFYHVDKRVCLVQEKIGSIVFLASPAKPGSIQDICWKDEYAKLAEYISNIFPENMMPRGLEAVLYCMPLAFSKARRRRLLKAPYFLTDQQKLTEFIPMLNFVTRVCPGFRNDHLVWEPKVSGDEFVNALKQSVHQTTRFGFLRFLFNCVKRVKVANGGKIKLMTEMIKNIDPDLLDDFFVQSYRVNWKAIPMMDPVR